MKKFIVIILILLSIFVGMYIYRKNKIEENRRHIYKKYICGEK